MLDSEQADLKAHAKECVQKLVEDFLKVVEQGKKDKYNEERVKITFVLPFLEALGWNPRTDEILPEQNTLIGRADFGLRLGGRTKIYVEMKKLHERLERA
jgi:predicted type IV restriction endonuclease